MAVERGKNGKAKKNPHLSTTYKHNVDKLVYYCRINVDICYIKFSTHIELEK